MINNIISYIKEKIEKNKKRQEKIGEDKKE